MNYRTDLALETRQILEEQEQCGGPKTTGFIQKTRQLDKEISLTHITITDKEGELAFGKPKGNYITLEIRGILEGKSEIKKRAARALADVLKELIPFHYYLKVLVVGLGNEKVTPDSLGPHTVDKVKITSHLFQIYECDGDWEMGNVSGFNPSVTGVTGMETAEVIQKVTSLVNPEVVIIVDSLAARDISRLSTTIQVSDTGISPGAGMGNRRKSIDEAALGCRVIAVGVPTVIDSRTLILDAAGEIPGWNQNDAERYFAEKELNMIVTSTDIDEMIRTFSEIIAEGINTALHPGIYS